MNILINKIMKFKTSKSNLYDYLVIILGLAVVSEWTLFRFFIKKFNYDLVGQQVLTTQIISGFHQNSLLGTTNYIYKMIFIYGPFSLLSINPILKLEIITLAINAFTFICIILLLKKIYEHFIKISTKLDKTLLLFFSSISGSVYWIEYANSRNIEVVMGLVLLYLVISITKDWNINKVILIFVFSSILFFSDPLQIVMSLLPAMIYYLFKNIRKSNFISRKSLILYASILLGYVFSKIALLLSNKILGIKIIPLTAHDNGYGPFMSIIKGFIPGLKQFGRLYVGGHEYGFIIEALNLSLLLWSLLMVVYFAIKKKINIDLISLILIFFSTDFLFYISSGQSMQRQTSRYLIMTVPLFILLLMHLTNIKSRLSIALKYFILFITLINIFKLCDLYLGSIKTRYSSNSQINSAIEYVKTPYMVSLASMDTAIPADYLTNGKLKLLPLNCVSGSKLIGVNLFFDKEYYINSLKNSQEEIPIIFDGANISSYPIICDIKSAEIIFGNPIRTETTSNGSIVLIYSKNTILNKLSF